MALVFYYKDMLEKVAQQFSAFSLLAKEPWKNPVKCCACVVSQKIAIKWKIALSKIRVFLENQSLEFHEIWHENTLGNK